MDFGYTNDDARFQAAVAWRNAAIADGWEATATYPTHEAIDRAASLSRDGFKVQILTRTKAGKWKYEAKISAWGPDGLAIKPPFEYDWTAIQAAVTHCNYCHKDGVETERVGFAGRCCATCLPEVRNSVERPGWTL